MITCFSDLCIYNKDNRCTLKSINISPNGTCIMLCVPDFPKEVVQKCKKELLDKLESAKFILENNLS